ncbi:class I SAM-dependent methyltransferase [bacterium]|nr:class I SAM-dependent methyltransferase [bacterium]
MANKIIQAVKSIRLEDQRRFIAEIAPYYSADRWQQRDIIEKQMLPLKPFIGKGYVLELGAGSGVVLDILNEWCERAVGVEIVAEMIREALAHDLQNIVRADGCCLPFPDCTFSTILIWGNTLGPIPGEENRLNMLKEAARVLQPDGNLLLSVIHRNSSLMRRFFLGEYTFHYRNREKSWQSENYGYNRSYSLRELTSVLKEAGFNDVEMLSARKNASLIVRAEL